MEIVCSSCGRSFEVDPARAKKVRAARCVCGARLLLEERDTREGPTRLGKYVILRRIAVGGMGEIFYGKIAGVEGFEREVAIKKMLPHLSEDRAFIDMMIKEAKLTVLLHHPNIVQVYDLAKEGKEYYIAMEYVPGVTVGHLLEHSHGCQAHLPYEVAVHITMQVLRGLAYAHDLRGPSGEPMNILHRDITPQNIMITRNGWVKVTDFGIAKARNEISTTSPGMIKGKLGYIAPEQLTGGTPDQRVDIFCAGILLWESLATRRLFKGADEIDTFRLISECKVPRLSEHRSDVPPEIEKALRGSLARLPQERYRTADEFYDALNHAIFPSTADDYATVAKRFLESKPEFFESIASLVEPEADGDSVTIEMTAIPEDEELIEITDVLAEDPRRKPGGARPSRAPRIAVAGAAILLLVVLGFVFQPKLGSWLRPEGTAPAHVGGQTPRENRLTTEEVQLAVDGERARFLECYRSGNRAFRRVPAIAATLVIPSTGGVAAVNLEPPAETLGKPGPCIEERLVALKFRPHADAKFETEVTLPPPRAGREAPAPAPAAGAKPLTGPEIQTVVQRYSGAIAKCLNGLAGVANAPKKVHATIVISQSGRVTSVALAPSLPKAPVETCLRRSLRRMSFRKHPARDFKVTIPLTITQI